VGLTVLIVEDDPDTARTLAELLRTWGYRSTVARNGQAALFLAQAEEPDVILLDLGLPIVDGWHVARKLAESGRTQRPFVIAISGHSLEPFGGDGIDRHLVKPVDPEQLRAELAQVGKNP
jgi:CheY-like chemotaxis protein